MQKNLKFKTHNYRLQKKQQNATNFRIFLNHPLRKKKLQKIYFLIFISMFILMTRRKATEALIHRVSNYHDLLPKMPRYCCPLVI